MAEEQNIKLESKSISSRSIHLTNDKFCFVCGDKAYGFNFGAVSCESCKAFFRRNALKNKISKCLFTHNCQIDINTRRFCPDCRLQKCFAIGMKKELILGEDKKNMRKKTKRKTITDSKTNINQGETTSSHDHSQDSLFNASPYLEKAAVNQININLYPNLDFNSQNNVNNIQSLSNNNPISFNIEKQVSIENNTSQIGSTLIDAIQKNGADNKKHMVDLSILNGSINGLNNSYSSDLYRKLTTMEDNLINELVQIYDLSFTVDLEPLIHIHHLDPTLNQLVNQSSITVLRLIKFAKRLEEFAKLDQVCQIGMLKGSWIYILFLRSLSLYNCDRDVWATPRGDIPTEILKNATGFVQLHDDHVRYCKSIKSIIGNDIVIVVILIVIVLFSPEEVNVHGLARQAISDIQDKYLLLLKHYLESHYTYINSAEMLPALMIKVKELKEFSEKHGKCLVDINPHEIEPIMLEILDLK